MKSIKEIIIYCLKDQKSYEIIYNDIIEDEREIKDIIKEYNGYYFEDYDNPSLQEGSIPDYINNKGLTYLFYVIKRYNINLLDNVLYVKIFKK